MRHQSTFSCNADGSTNVVSRHHSTRDVGRTQGVNGRRRGLFELVLEYDKSEEVQTTLGLFSARMGSLSTYRMKINLDLYTPLHTLSLQPGKTLNTLSSDGNDSEPVSSVVGKHIVVVARDYSRIQSVWLEQAVSRPEAYRSLDHRCQA
jgi:hypothetical protein